MAAARQVPASSLIVFRVAFGSCVALAACRFVARGWVGSLLVDPAYHFTYPGLSWVRPMPAVAMYGVYAVMAVAGAAFAAGVRPRVTAAAFTLAFLYAEAIDVTTYLNHYELVTLVGVLCVALPIPGRARGSARSTVPIGAIWLLRFQLGVVYVFAGLGKVDVDWLVRGEPLRTWLAGRVDQPVVGPVLGWPATAIVMSWAGAIFDLTVVAFLLRRRTRLPAYVVLVGFHVATATLFPRIGVFPLVMVVLTPIFFAPDWPLRLRLQLPRRAVQRRRDDGAFARRSGDGTPVASWVLVAAVVWIAVQVVVPLRHLAYPGDVRWTEEGYRWSWRVLLTEKEGDATFRVTDPVSGRTTTVFPSDELAPFQVRTMSTRPDLVRQYAHHLADEAEAAGRRRPEVRADVWVTVNGRPSRRLIDPAVDLAASPESLWPMPFVEPSPL